MVGPKYFISVHPLESGAQVETFVAKIEVEGISEAGKGTPQVKEADLPLIIRNDISYIAGGNIFLYRLLIDLIPILKQTICFVTIKLGHRPAHFRPGHEIGIIERSAGNKPIICPRV